MGKMVKHKKIRIISLIWTEQDQQPVCVVRIAGEDVDDVLDDLWGSGHIVINVIRFPFVPEEKTLARRNFCRVADRSRRVAVASSRCRQIA